VAATFLVLWCSGALVLWCFRSWCKEEATGAKRKLLVKSSLLAAGISLVKFAEQELVKLEPSEEEEEALNLFYDVFTSS